MSLKQRLTPYWLLGPGLLWLIVFFVVPMYFMGELALRSGSLKGAIDMRDNPLWKTEQELGCE